MEMNFCRRCGERTTPFEDFAYKCSNNHRIYKSQSTASSVLLVNDKNELLIAIRAIDPDKGKHDVPGGFCNVDETFLEAAKREMQEEVGITPDMYDEPEFLVNTVDSYLFEGETKPVQNVLFWARIHKDVSLAANDDVASAHWEALADIDLEKFGKGFGAIRVAVKKLSEQLL